MVFPGSIIPIVDNSGGRRAKLIHSFGRNKKFARVGDLVLISLKSVSPRKKMRVGALHKAVITLSPEWRLRTPAHRTRNNFWACIILKRDGLTPRATRIKLPVSLELYFNYQARTICLSPKVI